jgi:nucleoside phosphorylase
VSFTSKEDFEQHMLQDHQGKITSKQLSTFARIAARPAQRAFDKCPLCKVGPDSVGPAEGMTHDVIPDRLPRHVAGHLKSLALMFLPPGENGTDDETDSQLSSRTGRSSRKISQSDSGSIITFDDHQKRFALSREAIDEPITAENSDWTFLLGDQYSGPEMDPTLQTFVERTRSQPLQKWDIAWQATTMTQPSQPTGRGDFEIAIICALKSEADAVEALFDKFWGDDGEMYGKVPGDPSAYTIGVIGSYNVVLAHMPGMGKNSAAAVASSFRFSFGGIKLALVVGICSGVPRGADGEEILLGDVIISDGVIQRDFGKQYPNEFAKKDALQDSLGRPNPEIRALLNKLKGYKSGTRLRDNTSRYLIHLQQNLDINVGYPGVGADKLFEPTYRHKHHNFSACTLCSKCEKKEDEVCQTALVLSCSELKCNDNKLVPRGRLSKAIETSAQMPMIHYGLIASGDTVMKLGEHRDTVAASDNVIAFEMEGAGVWDIFPCVVIKGVCDYADSHKNKDWQNYAAATAAACMKAFLKEWTPTDKPWKSIAPPGE